MCDCGDQFDTTLGQRVEYQGHKGTVRFKGELPGQSGAWIGVEWDSFTRGKHDGSHNGVSYFKTSHPTSGSFIRPARLNFGISCVDAIQGRYGKVDGSTAGVDKDSIEEMKRKFNIPFVEMVGFEKVNSQQSQFEKLKVVHLSGDPIKCAGEQGQLSKLCPLVIELILSDTLLNSWNAVGDITVQFKYLTHLDLSNNKLIVPNEEDVGRLKAAFKPLSCLILNSLEYTWQDILTCANMWPCITMLSVQANKICELESPPLGVLSNLTILHLDLNPICDWTHVNKLGNLASLKVLYLGEVGIKNIFFPGESTTSLFPSLTELYLQNNEINDWISINELRKLASLSSLHLQSNPLLQQEKAWDFVIARLKNLKKLNGTEIAPSERKGCEYDYMKYYGREWLLAQNDPVMLREVSHQHPRYSELIESHGSFSEDDLAIRPSTLKSRLINVKIIYSNSGNVHEIQKKIPRNMTVQKLSGLVQKLINTKGHVPSLQAISAKAPDVKILLEKDMQELSFYSVEDGDSIAVNW